MPSAYDLLPDLTREEAIELLAIHTYTCEGSDDPRLSRSFIGSLRPFSKLYPESFHEVMACIKKLGPELGKSDLISRELVLQFWGLWHMVFVFAQDHTGELRGRGLITDEDIHTMDVWVGCISSAIMHFLDGCESNRAFEWYCGCFDS